MQTRCGCGETTQLADGFGELDERVESMQQPLSRGRTPPRPVCGQQLHESLGIAALRTRYERIAIEQPSGARMQKVTSKRCIIPGFRNTRGERLPVNGLR